MGNLGLAAAEGEGPDPGHVYMMSPRKSGFLLLGATPTAARAAGPKAI